MCREMVLFLKALANRGDKKLPLGSAASEPGALSWSPWDVTLGHCSLGISCVQVLCLLTALLHTEHSFISNF